MGISNGYREEGVDAYYENHSHDYENPHSLFVEHCLRHLVLPTDSKVLDVGCGNGLVTKTLKQMGLWDISGVDKYMAARYNQETGCKCAEVSFEDIAIKGLPTDTHYDVMICSYMVDIIHGSFRNLFMWNLASQADTIVVIRPNEKELKYSYLELTSKVKVQKSRMTVYKSKL